MGLPERWRELVWPRAEVDVTDHADDLVRYGPDAVAARVIQRQDGALEWLGADAMITGFYAQPSAEAEEYEGPVIVESVEEMAVPVVDVGGDASSETTVMWQPTSDDTASLPEGYVQDAVERGLAPSRPLMIKEVLREDAVLWQRLADA